MSSSIPRRIILDHIPRNVIGSLSSLRDLIVTSISHHSDHQSIRFFTSQPTSNPNNSSNNSVDTSRTKRDNRIRYFVINNRPSDALDLLERSLFRTPLPDPTSGKSRFLKLPPATVCNKVLDSAAQSKDPQLIHQASTIADALRLQGIELQSRTVQSLLIGLITTGQTDTALQVLDTWLASHQEELEDDSYASNDALQLFSSVLDTAARIENLDLVMMLLSRMARIGLSPAPRTLVSLIQCFMRLGHTDTAYGILQWMRKSDIEITSHTYSALLTMPVHATVKEARDVLKRAQKSYEEMKKYNIAPSKQYFTAYINVCARARDLKSALSMWNTIMSYNNDDIHPDVVMYSTMIDAYAKTGDEHGALRLFDSMIECGIMPDVTLYTALLVALKKCPEDAQRIWMDMKKSEVAPDASAYSAYVRCMLEAGQYDGVLQELMNHSSGGDNSSGSIDNEQVAGLYEQVLMFVARNNNMAIVSKQKLLARIVDQMNDQCVPYTAHSFAEILKLYTKHNNNNNNTRANTTTPSQYWSWLLSPPPSSIASSSSTSMSFTLHSSTTDHQSSTILHDIIISQLLVDSNSTTLQDDQLLLSLYNKQDNHNNNPSVVTAIIGALVVQGKFDHALTLFQQQYNHHESIDNNIAFWTAWSLQLLLYGARNSPSSLSSSSLSEQQQHAINQPSPMITRVLEVLSEARKQSKHACHGWWFDLPTQRAVGKLLRKVPGVEGVVGSVGGGDHSIVLEQNKKKSTTS